MTNFQNYKQLFPIFRNSPDLVYLDSAATRLKPKSVVDKLVEYYTKYSANIHRGIYGMSEEATEEYEKARAKVAEFIGAGKNSEVVFTKGTTEAINLVMHGWGEKFLKADDEMVLTIMEHHSNMVPWIWLSKKTGVKLKYVGIDEKTYRLKLDELRRLISPRTKLLAICQVSNVLGTINPVKEIVKIARGISPRVKVLVDGAQAVAHMPVDVKELGADFYAFSGHKMYGPTGIGVLWVKGGTGGEMEPVNFGGGMIAEVKIDDFSEAEAPGNFEGGTPPIAEAIGLGAAVDFIRMVGWEKIMPEETELVDYALKKLKDIEGVRIFSSGQGGVVSFSVEGIHAHDVAQILADRGICVRAGHHCAMPLHKILGVEATVRISLGLYNTKEDIDRLIEGLETVKKIFNV